MVVNKLPPAYHYRYTRPDSNGRPTDSKCRNLEIQKCRDFNHLILFNFFNQFWASFGNVWKYLTLAGTFWAQSSFDKIIDIFFLKPSFLTAKKSL
jgi:hypothetical protein